MSKEKIVIDFSLNHNRADKASLDQETLWTVISQWTENLQAMPSKIKHAHVIEKKDGSYSLEIELQTESAKNDVRDLIREMLLGDDDLVEGWPSEDLAPVGLTALAFFRILS